MKSLGFFVSLLVLFTLSACTGFQFRQGPDLPSGDDEAAQYFEILRTDANHGNPSAQYRLGQMYEQGIGVPQSFVWAHLLDNLARAQGHMEAGKARDFLAKRMTKEQVARAQGLTEKWWPSTHPLKPFPESIAPAKGEKTSRGNQEGPGDTTLVKVDPGLEKGNRISKGLIAEIQRLLQEKGLYTGAIDSIAGKKTITAILQYQLQVGLNPDGQVSEKLLESLNTSGPFVAVEESLLQDDSALLVEEPEQLSLSVKRPGQKVELIEAAASGDNVRVKKLLAEKKEVNAKNADGDTPLIAAARNGHLGTVLILLSNGADTLAMNTKGMTAMRIAQQKGHRLLVKLLNDSLRLVKRR